MCVLDERRKNRKLQVLAEETRVAEPKPTDGSLNETVRPRAADRDEMVDTAWIDAASKMNRD